MSESLRIAVRPPNFSDWPALLALLQAAFADMDGRIDPPSSLARLDVDALRARDHGRTALELQTRIELTENHATFAALGFAKVAETAHPGYTRATSITLRRRVG